MSLRTLVVVAVSFVSVAGWAAEVEDQEIGPVVAVKRVYTVDLAKCAAAWREYENSPYAGCHIKFAPKEGETGDYTVLRSWNDDVSPTPSPRVEISAYENGYQVNYTDNAENGKRDFATAKPEIEKLLASKAPSYQVSAIVHTVQEKKSLLASVLNRDPKPAAETYQFTANGCDTGKHTFTTNRTETAKAQLCKALKDEKTNKSCALDLRKAYFAQNCPGQTW